MRLVNLSTSTVILEHLQVRSTFLGKLKGFSLQRKPQLQTGMFFFNTPSIHTWGMLFTLDVYFFDRSMKFLGKKTNLVPGSFPSSFPKTRHILEIPHREIHFDLNLRVGDRIRILDGGLP